MRERGRERGMRVAVRENRETRKLNCFYSRIEVMFYKARCKIKCALWQAATPSCPIINAHSRRGRRVSGRSAEGRRADGEGRTKDRSALRRFSPLVVKRGYNKAQRDGLGESCTRCARLLSLTYSSHSVSCFCSLTRSPSPSPRGMARLFSMRQFNDASPFCRCR